jgi:peptidoglycan/xylan/chitin deacetylase (PgdA/CDA1 family)
MATILSTGGKRELLARGLLWSGVSLLLSKLPSRNLLLVLNYHRIGNPDDDLFDPGVFSATAEQFNKQISHLKRLVSLVTLEEALAFTEGTIKERTRHCRVLLTFDDGYLDNYDIAYPILRSHGVQGVFFLATSLVGSCHIPWWDHIAYLMKTARKRRFSLSYPANLIVDIDGSGLTQSLRAVLSLYKMPENSDSSRFMQQLLEETGGDDPPGSLRRFLNWDEAREMISGGMMIGSHTHSHHILSQLEPSRQFEELTQSQSILNQELGFKPDVLAYPVGGRTSFSDQTQKAARDAGYRAAFSFYGGTNLQGNTSPYDVNRIGVDGESLGRFKVQTAVCRSSGKYWP